VIENVRCVKENGVTRGVLSCVSLLPIRITIPGVVPMNRKVVRYLIERTKYSKISVSRSVCTVPSTFKPLDPESRDRL